jgi:hypothetical protein
MNVMNMDTCNSPESQAFDSYAAYRSAVAQIICAAKNELLLCEHNFSQSDLGSKIVCDALWAFFTLNPAANLRLIAFDSAYLSTFCPQFLQLTEKFSHKIELRLARESCHHWQQGFILSDKNTLLRRYHFAWPRGEITTDSHLVAMMQQQFDMLWEQSEPCNEWQRLYL